MRYVTVALFALVAGCGDNTAPGVPDAAPPDAPTDAAADAPPDAAPIVTCNADAIARLTAELERARDLLLAYRDQHGSFPAMTTARTPAADCCTQNVGGQRCCAAVAADWSTGVWPVIGFAIDTPQEFQLQYNGTASQFTLSAVGDRDCDATPNTYVMACSFTQTTPVECRLIGPPPDTD